MYFCVCIWAKNEPLFFRRQRRSGPRLWRKLKIVCACFYSLIFLIVYLCVNEYSCVCFCMIECVCVCVQRKRDECEKFNFLSDNNNNQTKQENNPKTKPNNISNLDKERRTRADLIIKNWIFAAAAAPVATEVIQTPPFQIPMKDFDYYSWVWRDEDTDWKSDKKFTHRLTHARTHESQKKKKKSTNDKTIVQDSNRFWKKRKRDEEE